MKAISKNVLSFMLAGILVLQPLTVCAAQIAPEQQNAVIEDYADTSNSEESSDKPILAPVESSTDSDSDQSVEASAESLTDSDQPVEAPVESSADSEESTDDSAERAEAEPLAEDGIDETPQLTNLPVVYITTENNEEITSKDYYLNADLVIRDGDNTIYDGVTEIKGRGNSTWGLPKKPYKLKLDKKTDLFDMGKNKHWVLLANYYDTSLMRNKLSYDMSGAMGMDQMESVWVDVVLNGKYVGNYQLCEQIRVGSSRVDIMDWEDVSAAVAEAIAAADELDKDTAGDLEDYLNEHMGWVTSGSFEFNGKTYQISDYYEEYLDITGGYLIELDANMDEASQFYTTRLAQPIMLKAPEFLSTNEEMMNYLQNYLDAFESAITNNATFDAPYDNETVHYTELFDMDALVDYWLIQELFFNEDGMKKSTYMNKTTGEPMKMGPIWDMDWAAGADQSAAKAYDQWHTKYFSMDAQKDQWYKYIVNDSYFLIKARERYLEIRDTLIEDMIKDNGSIDQYIAYLHASAEKNDDVWYGAGTFDREAQELKTWLINRVNWLDAQFQTRETFFNSLSNIKESKEAVTLQLENGTVLEKDDQIDGVLPEGSSLKVSVSSAKSGYGLFINSKLYTTVTDGTTDIVIPYEDALELADEANVITVKYLKNGTYDNSEVITATYTNGEAIPVVTVTEIRCTAPSKVEYIINEAFDQTGLKVEAVMSDGTIMDVTDSAVLSGFDSTTVGKKTITVTYETYTATFDVSVIADTAELIKAVAEVEKLDQNKYTESSWKAVADALQKANTVLTDKTASQEDVTKAVQDLNASVKQLEEKKPDTEPDTAELIKAVAEAEKLDKNKYTEASWKAVADALQKANALLSDKTASQEDITKAVQYLNASVKQLEEKKPDTEPEKPSKPDDKPSQSDTKPDATSDNHTAASGGSANSSSSNTAPAATTVPTNTSDHSMIGIWITLGIVSFIALAVLKRKHEC